MPESQAVTRILADIELGDRSAVDRLLPLVYEELRILADHHMQRERGDHTLQATALVHEAYLKLVRQEGASWQNRAHFIAVAAQAIRRILVDHARHHRRQKRGGDRQKLALDDLILATADSDLDVSALDDALGSLSKTQPRAAQVVEMRFFGGMTSEEAGAVLGVTARTVERDWQFARAWLYRAMHDHRLSPDREEGP